PSTPIPNTVENSRYSWSSVHGPPQQSLQDGRTSAGRLRRAQPANASNRTRIAPTTTPKISFATVLNSSMNFQTSFMTASQALQWAQQRPVTGYRLISLRVTERAAPRFTGLLTHPHHLHAHTRTRR